MRHSALPHVVPLALNSAYPAICIATLIRFRVYESTLAF
jgi:hypothetical protein